MDGRTHTPTGPTKRRVVPEDTDAPSTSYSTQTPGQLPEESALAKRRREDSGLHLKKSDILWILKKRRNWWKKSDSRLRNTKKEELLSILDPEPTTEELRELKERQTLASGLFPKLKMQDLTERLKRRGVSHSGLDKNELAERLDDAIKKGKTEEPVLDEDQQAVVNRWEDEELLINAGPGSGKTTTVCALVAHILNERPDSRVLVLAYNRCASKELRCRLQKRGATLLQKTKAFNPEPRTGCLVSTFDSFGFWSVPGVEEKTKTKSWAADYRLLLEQSAKILGILDKDNPARRWDWVVVDEAQDLNNTHASIVDTLHQSCRHLVVAGDPRQELYPGTTWFSEMWRRTPSEKRALLRYNYRSVPEIVDVINKFSSFNFPDLHHDQIAGHTDSSGSVEFCQATSEECGEAAGERLSKSPPNEAYAISPVSVHKFRTEPVTNTIRQVVHENNPGSHTFVFGEMNLPSFRFSDLNAYVIGTSRGLKGTERSRVVIYGITAPFCEYGISRSALAKLFYVAISRAKDHLHVIADGPLPGDNPMRCFPQFDVATSVVRKELFLPRSLPVKDLCKEQYTWCRQKQPEKMDPVSPIGIESKRDPDFVGLYLESVVAYCAGLVTADAVDNVVTKQQRGPQQQDFHIEDDNYIFNVPVSIQGKEIVEILKRGWQKNPCYALTAARWSLEIRRLWTVSSRLENDWEKHRTDCTPYAERIKRLLTEDETDESDVKYQCRQELPVTLHRSTKSAGVLVGVSDFSSDSGVAEIKFVQRLTTEHRLQAAMYAALHSVPHSFLINLRDGDVERVPAVRRKELSNLVRAKLALRHARNVGSSSNSRHKMPLPPDFVSTCCIAVDLEYESNMFDQTNTEFGAVAFTLDGQILGTFHRILSGVEPASGTDEPDDHSESEESDADSDYEIPDVVEGAMAASYADPSPSTSMQYPAVLAEEDDGEDPFERFPEQTSPGRPFHPPQLIQDEGEEDFDLDEDGCNAESLRPEWNSMEEQTEEYDDACRKYTTTLYPVQDGEEFDDVETNYAVRSQFSGPIRDHGLISKALQVCREVKREPPSEEDPIADKPETEQSDGTHVPWHEYLTGLKIRDYRSLRDDQERTVRRFHRWVERVSGRRCFIFWSGTEDRSLRLGSLGTSYDVMPLYRAWLKENDMGRPTGFKLTDCVQQVLGPAWPFEPHRAFEDAVATAAVFLALTESA